jgi:predicted dehydrogenase
VYAELNNGGRALIRASQFTIGRKNDMGIEIAGTKGTLRWAQEDPEKITINLPGKPDLVYWRGVVQPNDGFLKDVPAELLGEITIPSGHVEAHHDAFARLHRSFEADVRAYLDKKPFNCDGSKYANVEDGRMGIYFITKAVESHKKGGVWVDM